MIWGKQFLSGSVIGLFLPCALLLWTPPGLGEEPAERRRPIVESLSGDYDLLLRTSALLQDSIIQGASTYLEPNRPNPFIGTTRIGYSIAATTPVRLRIYDFFYDPVETLVDVASQAAGTYEVVYTPKGISSGMYFYELKTNQGVELKRMLYIK
jgi:hypothetical protein